MAKRKKIGAFFSDLSDRLSGKKSQRTDQEDGKSAHPGPDPVRAVAENGAPATGGKDGNAAALPAREEASASQTPIPVPIVIPDGAPAIGVENRNGNTAGNPTPGSVPDAAAGGAPAVGVQDPNATPTANPNPGPVLAGIQNGAPAIGVQNQSLAPKVPVAVPVNPTTAVVKPPRLSCWAQAAEELKGTKPEVFAKLEYEDSHKHDPADLMKVAEAKKKEKKKLPPWLERSIRSVLQFKDFITAAAAFDPHKCAPIVWKTVVVVLEACLNESNLHRGIQKDLEGLTSTLSYWANVESLYLGAINNETLDKFQGLETQLVQLNIAILELQVELVSLMEDGAIWQAFVVADRLEIWKRVNDLVTVRNSNCKTAFESCKMAIDRYDKIKKWISDYQRDTSHTAILERTGVDDKYRGCGQWLFDMQEFKNWSSSQPQREALWIRGTTGTGKTTLLARSIEWCLNRTSLYPDRRLIYFYCARGKDKDDKSSTPSYSLVLRALLRQAAFDYVTGEVFSDVLQAYKSAGGDTTDLKPLGLKDCKDLLGKIVKSGVKLRIMIDALDECEEPKDVLIALRDAAKDVPGGIELLVSSRYEVHVDEKFPTVVPIDVNTSMDEIEMITYIATEVQDRETDERLLQGEYPELEDELIEILRKRAGGMFRWVQLQLSFFLNPRSPVKHDETVRKHLKTLNTGSVADEKDLQAAYEAIFNRNTAESDIERKHASKIYKMLLCCGRPLSMIALSKALQFDDGNSKRRNMDKYIRQLTQDFIIETRTGALEFAHASVMEYLQGPRASEYSSTIAHAETARACLMYISSQDSAIFALQMQSDPFLKYAHRFWGHHCAKLSKEERQNLEVSKVLVDWILKGTGPTTYQNWQDFGNQNRRKYEYFLGDPEEPPVVGSPIFACCWWNLVELLEMFLLEPSSYDMDILLRNSMVNKKYRSGDPAPDFSIFKDKVGINSRDSRGRKPLSLAATNGHSTIAKLLIDSGAELNYLEGDNFTSYKSPLCQAAENGHEAVVSLLLSYGAELNFNQTGNPERPELPLNLAARRGHLKVVQLLMARDDVDLNGKDPGRRTPLELAAANGHEAVVELFLNLEEGIDPNYANPDGLSPLSMAAYQGHHAVVELFLKKNADLDRLKAENPNGWHNQTKVKVWERGKFNGRTRFAKKKANVNWIDGQFMGIRGGTPLTNAAERGHVAVVELLLKDKDVDPNLPGRLGYKALQWAEKNHHEAIAEMLRPVTT